MVESKHYDKSTEITSILYLALPSTLQGKVKDFVWAWHCCPVGSVNLDTKLGPYHIETQPGNNLILDT